jgi:hypothetical protein
VREENERAGWESQTPTHVLALLPCVSSSFPYKPSINQNNYSVSACDNLPLFVLHGLMPWFMFSLRSPGAEVPFYGSARCETWASV